MNILFSSQKQGDTNVNDTLAYRSKLEAHHRALAKGPGVAGRLTYIDKLEYAVLSWNAFLSGQSVKRLNKAKNKSFPVLKVAR